MMTTEEWNDKPCGGTDPDLTAPEAVERAIGMCRLHGLHGTEAKLRALSARAEAAEAKLKEAVDIMQFARNRLEMIADKSWNGDARDFKRSLVGVFSGFDAFLASLEGDKPDE